MPEWNGMEWKILRMERRQPAILPYQFDTRFRAWYLQKILAWGGANQKSRR